LRQCDEAIEPRQRLAAAELLLRAFYAIAQRIGSVGGINGCASIEDDDISRRAWLIGQYGAQHRQTLLGAVDANRVEISALQTEVFRRDAVAFDAPMPEFSHISVIGDADLVYSSTPSREWTTSTWLEPSFCNTSASGCSRVSLNTPST